MRPLSRRDRRALAASTLLLAPALLWAAVARPYVSALDEARQRLREERTLLARERALLADAPNFPVRRQRAGAALGATWTHIVRGADTLSIAASVARAVSDAADDAGLQVEQVESRGADSARRAQLARGALVASTVELRARGDLQRVLRFLSEMEGGETYLRVDRLQIAVAPSAGDAPDQETLALSATVTDIARVLARPAAFYVTPPRPHRYGAPLEAAFASPTRSAP
jgi:hypothetical protein